MISCTEFIPLYSEFFKFLEKRGGHEAVVKYWEHISDSSIGDKTNPNSLAYKCEKYGGFEGAIAYWGHTLTEEACDLLEMRDGNARVRYLHMRHCPSRGMLNSLSHVEPYYDYCSHCDLIYSRVLEKYGVVYERDKTGIDRAECRDVLYEVGNPPSFDFRRVSDEQIKRHGCEAGVSIVDMKSEDNKYLHRDFHLSGDLALKYCGDKFGKEAVIDFLSNYVRCFYAPTIERIKKQGLSAMEEWIKGVYEVEEASDILHTELSDGRLTVTIDKCPVIEYMHSLNQEPSEYYVEETRTLYATVAAECGYKFTLEYYNEDGGARFIFEEKKYERS